MTLFKLQIYVSSIQTGARKLIPNWWRTTFEHLKWNGTFKRAYRDDDEGIGVQILKGFVAYFKVLSSKWWEGTDRIWYQRKILIDWPKFELGTSQTSIQSVSAIQMCLIFVVSISEYFVLFVKVY